MVANAIPTSTQTSNGRKYLIALVAALGLIPIALDATVVNVVLTPIRQALHADVNTAAWIITAYFLANAAFVTIGGYLGNLFGVKRIFILGLAIFTLGSALCSLSTSMEMLIGFRVLQGIGGGILLPIGPALAFDSFEKDQRAKASALVGVPLLLAPIFGPILGGYLADTFDWQSIFYINLPVGAIAIILALWALPRDHVSKESGARFDIAGLSLSTLGVIAIIYGFSLVTRTDPGTVTVTNPNGSIYGWGYWLVWALAGAGALLLAIFALLSLRVTRDPALDLRQLARRDFLVASIFAWATALFSFGLLVLLPIYFESVLSPGLSAFDTGLAMVPYGIGSIVGTIAAAALYRALGPRWVAMLGAGFSAGSAWLLAQVVHPTATIAQIVAAAQTHTAVASLAGADALRWGLLLSGLSVTFIGIPMQTLALESLTGKALAKASSLYLSTKLIFSSVGVAILTTLLLNFTQARATTLFGQLQAQSGGAASNPSDPAAIAALHALLAQIGAQAGAYAIQNIFWLIFWASLILVALALTLPGRRHVRAASASASEAAAETPAQPVGV